MKDDSNTEPSAKILSFPTEQRRVSVATEREADLGMLFTSDDLKSMINLEELIKIDLENLNFTIQTDHDSFTCNWDELMEKSDHIQTSDFAMFSQPKNPYTQCLETITDILVNVHNLNGRCQDGTLDELNYQLKDILSWLINESDNKS